jgi:hypothetical protein
MGSIVFTLHKTLRYRYALACDTMLVLALGPSTRPSHQTSTHQILACWRQVETTCASSALP